jgi:dTDP-4-amino-4,6-dideoxygalactose transaminase
MFWSLPPVGEHIRLERRSVTDEWLRSVFGQRKAAFYDSGTSALAAAIIAAVRRKGVDKAEVLLPGYGCPSLVSATIYAKAKPVLVDLAPNSPWVDLDDLSRKLTPHTVAVVAVDLLGIPERLSELRLFCRERELLLIEDSAQALPKGDEDGLWQGDFVILSFGRGKPVSLLAGGAILTPDRELHEVLPHTDYPAPVQPLAAAAYGGKVRLYDRLLHPRLYWLVERLPFLDLGKTVHVPLRAVNPMPRHVLERLPPNVRDYREQLGVVQATIREKLQELASPDLADLPAQCRRGPSPRLLRYPVLASRRALRDDLLSALRLAGLGATALYGRALPFVPGLEGILAAQANVPQAQAFAERLITLPVHSQIAPGHVNRIVRILRDTLRG